MHTLVLPGATMVLTANGWTFPYEILSESGEFVLAGGNSRMLAVWELFCRSQQDELDFHVFVTGGLEYGAFSRSDEVARQLFDVFKVPSACITSLGGDGSTKGNALALSKFLSCTSPQQLYCSFDIVTNSYHSLRTWIIFADVLFFHFFRKDPIFSSEIIEDVSNLLVPSADVSTVRLRVMEKLGPIFDSLPVSLNVLTVEDILSSSHNYFYKVYAQELLHHPRMFQTMLNEYRGIKAYLNRSYGK